MTHHPPPPSEGSLEEVDLEVLQAAGRGTVLEDLLVGVVEHLRLEVLHEEGLVLKGQDLGFVDGQHADEQGVDDYLSIEQEEVEDDGCEIEGAVVEADGDVILGEDAQVPLELLDQLQNPWDVLKHEILQDVQHPLQPREVALEQLRPRLPLHHPDQHPEHPLGELLLDDGVAGQLFVVLNGQQAEQDTADEVHALRVAPPAEVHIGHQYPPQLGKILGHSLCSFDVLVDGIDLPFRQSTHIRKLFEGVGGQLLHLHSVGKYLPHILSDLVVDALEDREVEILLGVRGKIRGIYYFLPLLEGQRPPLASLTDQQEIFDVHILYPLLLRFFNLPLPFPQDDEVLAGRFLEDVLNDEFEAAGLDARDLGGGILFLRLREVCFELSEEVHKQQSYLILNSLQRCCPIDKEMIS